MTQDTFSTEGKVLVAIDVAKISNEVLVKLPDGTGKKLSVVNNLQDYRNLVAYLHSVGYPCLIGFEATGDYHRPLAHYLEKEGFNLRLISSLAIAKTRESLYNTWDKNDPKDCRAILHMLQTDVTQTYCNPIVSNDIKEICGTYYQISLRKVRLYHTIVNHFLPLYFPEVEKYLHNSRSEWFFNFLFKFPCPASVQKYNKKEFSKDGWDLLGRKDNKKAWLTDFYETATQSIGLPVDNDSEAIHMFRMVIKEYIELCRMRMEIEKLASKYLKNNPDCQRLQTISGIGPVYALTILAEAGDLRRFSHYKKFLKYCGLDLCTQRSGKYRGVSRISKRDNSRLRCVFWMAATVAIRMRENTFRKKSENYIKSDPKNKDLKRKAYTAVAAKVARVAYSLIKSESDYRCFHESAIPGGKIPSRMAVEAIS
jgi:transposase